MTRAARVFVGVVLGGTVLVTATLGATAAALYHPGTIAVTIEEQGHHVQLDVPAGLVQLALALTPAAALEETAFELAPLLPALAAGWRELAESPDFVLLETRSADESVRIGKAGSRLEVSIDAADAHVRVALPLSTVRSVLHKLDRQG